MILPNICICWVDFGHKRHKKARITAFILHAKGHRAEPHFLGSCTSLEDDEDALQHDEVINVVEIDSD